MSAGRRISILVVDDDEGLLRALHKMLGQEGFRVTPASWAAEAMEHLDNPHARFDLIVTDLYMPFVGGASILRMITEHVKLRAMQAMPAADERIAAEGTPANFDRTGEPAYRSARAAAAIPVIVLTAYGSADVRQECLILGAAAFLEKPLDTRELLTAIDAVLEQPKDGCDREKTRAGNSTSGRRQQQ
jgi:DNA-binding response OmpR family regulator